MSDSKQKDCQICHERKLQVYIDGATLSGRWANMCRLCHIAVGKGLGTGRGQKYEWNKEIEKYIKVEG